MTDTKASAASAAPAASVARSTALTAPITQAAARGTVAEPTSQATAQPASPTTQSVSRQTRPSLTWLGEWSTPEGRVVLYDRPGAQEASLVLIRPRERTAVAEVFHAGGVVRALRWFGPACELSHAWRASRRTAVAALIAAYAVADSEARHEHP